MKNTVWVKAIFALALAAALSAFARVSAAEDTMTKEIPITITVGNHTLQATLQDNATSRALVARFPLTLPMMDLYGREMCYRFPDALPAREAQRSGYEVGDIAYWVPGHSLVIFYRQNGEIIDDLQRVGHIASGVDVFSGTGDARVTFELAK